MKKYADTVFAALQAHYPQAKMTLTWSNNTELLFSIILSAQCTDAIVNTVTTKAFPKYRKQRSEFADLYTHYSNLPLDKEERIELVNFAHIPLHELEQDIKSTGFYRNKAKHVQAAAYVILETYGGILPKTISELTKIPGVGRKTANVFLGNAYQIYEGIAVDTHVKKQAQRLKLTTQTDPDKIEQELMKLYDRNDWFSLTYLLIEYGRNMRKKKTKRVLCGDIICLLCREEREL